MYPERIPEKPGARPAGSERACGAIFANVLVALLLQAGGAFGNLFQVNTAGLSATFPIMGGTPRIDYDAGGIAGSVVAGAADYVEGTKTSSVASMTLGAKSYQEFQERLCETGVERGGRGVLGALGRRSMLEVEDAGEFPWGQAAGALRTAAGVNEELCDKGKEMFQLAAAQLSLHLLAAVSATAGAVIEIMNYQTFYRSCAPWTTCVLALVDIVLIFFMMAKAKDLYDIDVYPLPLAATFATFLALAITFAGAACGFWTPCCLRSKDGADGKFYQPAPGYGGTGQAAGPGQGYSGWQGDPFTPSTYGGGQPPPPVPEGFGSLQQNFAPASAYPPPGQYTTTTSVYSAPLAPPTSALPGAFNQSTGRRYSNSLMGAGYDPNAAAVRAPTPERSGRQMAYTPAQTIPYGN